VSFRFGRRHRVYDSHSLLQPQCCSLLVCQSYLCDAVTAHLAWHTCFECLLCNTVQGLNTGSRQLTYPFFFCTDCTAHLCSGLSFNGRSAVLKVCQLRQQCSLHLSLPVWLCGGAMLQAGNAVFTSCWSPALHDAVFTSQCADVAQAG
jgi:hypothetical protein